MRASDLLTSRVTQDGKGIVIEALQDNTFTVKGCSAPYSAQPDGDNLNSCVVVPTPTSVGVLALRVRRTDGYGKNFSATFFGFLLRIWVHGTNNMPQIDLKDTWTPPSDRLLQITESSIQIKITDVWFTTGKFYGNDDKEKKAGHHYDVNGDLMCRYASGDIDAYNFCKQVASLREEQSRMEMIRELEFATTELESEIESLTQAKSRAKTDLDALKLEGRLSDVLAKLAADLERQCSSIEVRSSAFFTRLNRRFRFGKLLESWLVTLKSERQAFASQPTQEAEASPTSTGEANGDLGETHNTPASVPPNNGTTTRVVIGIDGQPGSNVVVDPSRFDPTSGDPFDDQDE